VNVYTSGVCDAGAEFLNERARVVFVGPVSLVRGGLQLETNTLQEPSYDKLVSDSICDKLESRPHI
jgi:hypothetical protein